MASRSRRGGVILASLAMAGMVAPRAHADDACTVVLCLSFSKWDQIGQCVPPVRKALRDALLGKPPKKCKMASAINSSTSGEAQAESLPASRENCPAGHWRGGRCDYAGVIRVSMDGQTWTNTWWDAKGNTASQTCPAAPSTIAQTDTSTLESLLARTRELDTYATAASEAAALTTDNKPADECESGTDCAPAGISRPPLPADQNCKAAAAAAPGTDGLSNGREPASGSLMK